MKMTKKLIAILLSLIMVFTMIAVPVSAAGTIAEDTAVEEVVGEETTDEEVAEEESVGEFHEIFEAIKNLIEAIHNLVGGIMGNLGKECPFCGEVHEKDAGEDGYYTVIFNLNYEGAPEAEKQKVKAGECVVLPEEPERDGYIFVGWYKDIKPTDFTNNNILEPVSEDIILYAYWLLESDSDGDQLIDGLEMIYGTDISNKDTDGDSLSDYIEIIILGTDPLKKNDSTADSDGDGISDVEEVKLGTDPSDNDTDADQLDDANEEIYNTDPLNYDTDGDGVSDGLEIQIGTNPLVAEENFDVSITSDDSDTVKPTVDITLKGDQVSTLAVDGINDENLFPEDMPGYLGKAYDFSVTGTFDEATISFEFDEEILKTGAEPTIFYFNEEEQLLEELDTNVVGNVASTTVTHFSTYILIDRIKHYESFKWEDTWDSEDEYESVEIVLVIDDSGSMDWNDPYFERLSVARTLVDKLPENSKIGLVRFDGGYPKTEALTKTLTTDKEYVKNFLTRTYFYSPGGTDMYNGIQKAFPLYESTDETTLKMMVVLSDGETEDTYLHSSVISTANNSNIKIYTVGLGSSTSYFNNYLKPLASKTGGEFYLASNADQLADIYKDINQKIDLEIHSDNDNIPDYYEDNMVSFNGRKIEMDKTKDDTDGDGLKDNEEVEVVLVYNEDRSKVYVKGKINSYPDLVDSDNDSISDFYDPEPMSYTITDRTLSWVEGLSYTNLTEYAGKTVGYALDAGVKLDGISEKTAQYLKDAIIVYANDSGKGYWKDFWDSGLSSIALMFVRQKQPTAIVYALRGTEFDDDFANDTTADLVLGVGWDSFQSKTAFLEYKAIANNSAYQYYITGHSLGGRLAQDVLYKIYNANEGGFFKKKANIITPVHSATFNSLGYNQLVYRTLENDVLNKYKNKLSNFYYTFDLVGEGLGCSGVFTRAGVDVQLLCKNEKGELYRDFSDLGFIVVRDSDYHGISYFQKDYDLLYNSYHSFNYWVS